ncbi:MAG: biotin/lipoyl-containing protein [Eubacteriales bacterium]|nr:biotin/lipoyl-binding protein [Clostridiales bacterium]MDY2982284.1 biotin/lipoyl-containing protein [Eubacteriales bacterium]
MRKFNVNVNGTLYEVEVEEIQAGAAAAPARKPIPAAAPKAAAPKAAAPKAAPARPAAAPAGAETVKAPMPGNILEVRVKDGQAVQAGDVLFILEAMKMENEIMAPAAGTVSGVAVQKGSAVATGAVLCHIG